MRRLVAVSIVAVMLALAATALAAVLPKSGWHFKGTLNDGSGQPIKFGKFTDPVTFSISGKNVKNFKFGSALICTGGFGGPPPSSNPFTKKTVRIASMKIKKSGKVYNFTGSTNGPSAGGTTHFTVTGSFATSGKKASGRVTFICPSGGPSAFIAYSAKKK